MRPKGMSGCGGRVRMYEAATGEAGEVRLMLNTKVVRDKT
jgi:hypothetical protein